MGFAPTVIHWDEVMPLLFTNGTERLTTAAKETPMLHRIPPT